MDRFRIQKLCDDASKAVGEVRDVFQSRLETFDVLDRFWALEDCLHRLVQASADDRKETHEILQNEHAGLIVDIADVLRLTREHRIGSLAAVHRACGNTDLSLSRIGLTRQAAASYSGQLQLQR